MNSKTSSPAQPIAVFCVLSYFFFFATVALCLDFLLHPDDFLPSPTTASPKIAASKPQLSHYLKDLESPHRYLRQKSIQYLLQHGQNAIPTLRSKLHSPQPQQKRIALFLLLRLLPAQKALKLAQNQLTSPNPQLRLEALHGILQLSSKISPNEDQLRPLLLDNSFEVVKATLKIYQTFPPKQPITLLTIAQIAKKSPSLAPLAIQILAKTNSLPPQILPPLFALWKQHPPLQPSLLPIFAKISLPQTATFLAKQLTKPLPPKTKAKISQLLAQHPSSYRTLEDLLLNTKTASLAWIGYTLFLKQSFSPILALPLLQAFAQPAPELPQEKLPLILHWLAKSIAPLPQPTSSKLLQLFHHLPPTAPSRGTIMLIWAQRKYLPAGELILSSFPKLNPPNQALAIQALATLAHPKTKILKLLKKLLSTQQHLTSTLAALRQWKTTLPLEQLRPLLNNPSRTIQSLSAQLLPFANPIPPLSWLLALMKNPNPTVRQAACQSLAKYPQQPEAWLALLLALTDAHPNVQAAAAKTLQHICQISSPNSTYLPLLLNLAQGHSHPNVRKYANALLKYFKN
ncbi:MAG: HEAT repeat domain-containing protein [Planctomycetota bacterium]|nr:MAG: HEAT repeat domain-containing protein [Planctomycetota bacterium]